MARRCLVMSNAPVGACRHGDLRTMTPSRKCPARMMACRALYNGDNMRHEIADGVNGTPAQSQGERAALALIQSALTGQLAPEEAARQVAHTLRKAVESALPTQDPEQHAAQQACAFAAAEAQLKQQGRVPEVVFGPGKSPTQVADMLQNIVTRQRLALATRVDPDMYAAVRKIVPGVEYNARARLLSLHAPDAASMPRPAERLPGAVAIVSGGSGDQAIAEECKLLAEHLGCFCFSLPDLGLGNGLVRLLGCLSALRAADVVVVVCGLDGALASVVAGLVDAPVIAVPTSSGYGATLAGAAPLLAQLSCTTPGVTVVNIDNGLGAAMAVQKMLRMANKLAQTRLSSGVQRTAAAATRDG